jgi:hypothetical protein
MGAPSKRINLQKCVVVSMAPISPSVMSLPEAFSVLLSEKDGLPEDFSEAEVSFALERLFGECGEVNENQRKAALAEIAALQMQLADSHQKSRWGTRFGPAVEGIRQDGSPYFFPDIANIDAGVVQYWGNRCGEVHHPVLKARYADVIWDMTKAVTGDKPSIDFARQAIDAYIECGTRYLNTDTAENRLERALELSISLGDKTRAGAASAAMFRLLDATEHPGSRLIWLFDLPYRMRGVTLSAEQERNVMGGLEAELQRICGSENPVGLVAKEPAVRLARYYEKHGQQGDMKRVLRTYGEALAKFAEKTQGFVAMHWYQEAYGIFLKLDEIGKQLEATRKQSKLLSMFPVAKLGENQVIARAGSIEDDPEGRMMLQMADNLKYTAIFLGKALAHTRARYEFTSKTVLPVLFQSPVFDPGRTFLLEQGIDAYFANDHVKTIHVLVPQIEHCLRRLLAILGRPTNKHRRSDLSVMIEKSLNDFLESEPLIQRCLGDDATFYLRVLLCDPRGFNVRNDLAHGLIAPANFNRFLSDRVMHVLFLLAQLRLRRASS